MSVSLTLGQVQELVRAAGGPPVSEEDALRALRSVLRVPAGGDHPLLRLDDLGPLPRASSSFSEPAANAGAGAGTEAGADEIEPLLVPGRLEVGDTPPERMRLRGLFDKQVAVFWTDAEIDMAHDRPHWEAMTDGERHFVSMVLAFFAQADGLVGDNAGSNFMDEVGWREGKMNYAVQAFMETIHNLAYTQMINALIRDPAERRRLFDAISTIPAIGRKGAWIRRYMNRALPLANRIVAFVIAEGVFFSGAFCALFWLKKRGLMPGLTFANELISRDEGLHAQVGCEHYRHLRRKLPESDIHAMFADAVDVEAEFVCDALPVSLIGMNADSMTQYVRFVADFWLVALGYAKLYNAANPFEWMSLISLEGKTNFFEKRVSEYSLAGGGAFDTTADF